MESERDDMDPAVWVSGNGISKEEFMKK